MPGFSPGGSRSPPIDHGLEIIVIALSQTATFSRFLGVIGWRA